MLYFLVLESGNGTLPSPCWSLLHFVCTWLKTQSILAGSVVVEDLKVLPKRPQRYQLQRYEW